MTDRRACLNGRKGKKYERSEQSRRHTNASQNPARRHGLENFWGTYLDARTLKYHSALAAAVAWPRWNALWDAYNSSPTSKHTHMDRSFLLRSVQVRGAMMLHKYRRTHVRILRNLRPNDDLIFRLFQVVLNQLRPRRGLNSAVLHDKPNCSDCT